MKKAILATKVGMTQIFNEDGLLIPVTVLQAGPCVVTQVKTEDNDGYAAVQVGFGEIREKLVNKPEKGHFEKAGVDVKRFLKEFRFDNAAEYQVGQEIKADIFAAGDHIDATAISKGKGFQGAIKRHGPVSYTHLDVYKRQAVISLKKGDEEKIRAVMKDLSERRTEKQPLDYPSAGSTFKRPEGYFAGKLIMDSGLRGYRAGGAQVSEKHCGFVINAGGATAEDVRTLMEHVIEVVREKYGVTLEPEVKFLGDFNGR